MKKKMHISTEEALRIGESLYIDWNQIDPEQFRQGLMAIREQRTINPETGRIHDSLLLSGRVVLVHMQEFPDYFTRLEKLTTEVNEYRVEKSN